MQIGQRKSLSSAGFDAIANSHLLSCDDQEPVRGSCFTAATDGTWGPIEPWVHVPPSIFTPLIDFLSKLHFVPALCHSQGSNADWLDGWLPELSWESRQRYSSHLLNLQISIIERVHACTLQHAQMLILRSGTINLTPSERQSDLFLEINSGKYPRTPHYSSQRPREHRKP